MNVYIMQQQQQQHNNIAQYGVSLLVLAKPQEPLLVLNEATEVIRYKYKALN